MQTFLQKKVSRITDAIAMQDRHVKYLDRYIEDLYKVIARAKRDQKRCHAIGNKLMIDMAANQLKMSAKERAAKVDLQPKG
jgi:hypothetical protein